MYDIKNEGKTSRELKTKDAHPRAIRDLPEVVLLSKEETIKTVGGESADKVMKQVGMGVLEGFGGE